ncbi:hypothetical protein C8R45DRAFT_935319 [Mycena sanguinolenta]|nr:hypothetical protein C8R45DRAFT_935319 [Mycena sanguinolenta]
MTGAVLPSSSWAARSASAIHAGSKPAIGNNLSDSCSRQGSSNERRAAARQSTAARQRQKSGAGRGSEQDNKHQRADGIPRATIMMSGGPENRQATGGRMVQEWWYAATAGGPVAGSEPQWRALVNQQFGAARWRRGAPPRAPRRMRPRCRRTERYRIRQEPAAPKCRLRLFVKVWSGGCVVHRQYTFRIHGMTPQKESPINKETIRNSPSEEHFLREQSSLQLQEAQEAWEAHSEYGETMEKPWAKQEFEVGSERYRRTGQHQKNFKHKKPRIFGP